MEKFKKLLRLFWTFFKVGAFTFGGGRAMVPLIQREIVEKNNWMTENEMTDMIAVAESTPGPLAVNMATFSGHKYAGFWGSVAATVGLVLPSFIFILLLAIVFETVMDNKWVAAAFMGIRAGVVALLAGIVIKLFRDMEKSLVVLAVFLIAFLLATFVNIDVIFIIIAAGVFGLLWQTLRLKKKKKEVSPSDENEGDGQ